MLCPAASVLQVSPLENTTLVTLGMTIFSKEDG